MDILSQDYLDEANICSTKWTPFTNCTQRNSTGFTWIIPLPPTIEPWEIGTNILETSSGHYSKLQAEYSGNKRSTYYPLDFAGKKIYLCKIQAWPWKPAESTRNCILL